MPGDIKVTYIFFILFVFSGTETKQRTFLSNKKGKWVSETKKGERERERKTDRERQWASETQIHSAKCDMQFMF